MAFYDNVKDRVRNQETTDKEDTDTEGDNVAFDELIKKAEEEQDQEEESEEDDTEIEDFSAKSTEKTGDYGDPSSIELNETEEPQAGRQSEKKTDKNRKSPTNAQKEGSTKTTSSHATSDTSEEATTDEVELHQDGSVGDPGSEPDETVEREESELIVLQEIRNQNEQMLGLLKAIKKNLDQR